MLGLQLHMGGDAPDTPGRVQPVTMDWPATIPRRPGQASAGLWTATVNANGSAAAVDFAALNAINNGRYGMGGLWCLTPDPAAQLVTIDSRADYDRLRARYPWPAGGIDWPALFADTGADGVHLTHAGALACRGTGPGDNEVCLGWWCYESVHWNRYAFTACERVPLDSAAYPLTITFAGQTFNMVYTPARLVLGHETEHTRLAGRMSFLAHLSVVLPLLIQSWDVHLNDEPVPIGGASTWDLPRPFAEAVVAGITHDLQQRHRDHLDALRPLTPLLRQLRRAA